MRTANVRLGPQTAFRRISCGSWESFITGTRTANAQPHMLFFMFYQGSGLFPAIYAGDRVGIRKNSNRCYVCRIATLTVVIVVLCGSIRYSSGHQAQIVSAGFAGSALIVVRSAV